MRSNVSRDTQPEMKVRRLLHATGLRYRVDYTLPLDVRRRADIVFTRIRLAVFVDGCYWHGCPDHYRPPAAHSDYWFAKVTRNRERDVDTDRRLHAAGWTVLRYWEHEAPEIVAESIVRHVQTAQASLTPQPES